MINSPCYELYGIELFILLSVLPLLPPVFYGFRWLRNHPAGDRQRNTRKLIGWCVFSGTIYASVIVDAFLIEPNWPQLRTIEIPGRLASELSILHLSDLHIEREMARRDRWLIRTADRLKPDLILITGDIHQLNVLDPPSLGRVLGSLKAPLGVFACRGFDDSDLLRRTAPHISCLENQTAVIQHGSDRIILVGMPRTNLPEVKTAALKSDYGIVLDHMPDHVKEAAELSADLYLCGHTHGGQVRIPFWGAIITNCDSGKKYEAGLYHAGSLFVHTSRGFGLEPRPAPQVRFFCRPEITLIKVFPQKH
jgi:predicted MPP superfamily phosphohydrolase